MAREWPRILREDKSFPPLCPPARASGGQEGLSCGFGAGLPWSRDCPCGAGPSPGSSSKGQGPQEGSEELWSFLTSTSRTKGLGAWGAMSLRATEPGGSALHPPTLLLSSAPWLKVRGKG